MEVGSNRINASPGNVSFLVVPRMLTTLRLSFLRGFFPVERACTTAELYTYVFSELEFSV